jgi:hypothetical protein
LEAADAKPKGAVMPRFILAWAIVDSDRRQGGNKQSPDRADIGRFLDIVELGSGSLTLDSVEDEGASPKTLQVLSDDGKYLMTLGADDGCEYLVRTLHHEGPKPGQTEILGNLWNSDMVTTDFSIVRRAFMEMFETNDVSRDVLA